VDCTPLLRALACAAINAALRSVLVYDVSPDGLHVLADAWAALLAGVDARQVVVQWLTTGESEEQLWGSWQPISDSAAPGTTVSGSGRVIAPRPAERLSSIETQAPPVTPLPEDRAPVQRDPAPLRLPPLPSRARTIPRGPIIGSEPTTDLRDLAITATILEAAKFAVFRRPPEEAPGGPLRIKASDLRRHRRAPAPERMLVLVLDCTAAPDEASRQPLEPYLREAYVRRAAICVVLVGANDDEQSLRASRVMARNLLSPAVAAALGADAGTATPLAHGLELAGEAIRRALLRGRDTLTEVALVVLTDGRGNVPLAASLAGELTTAVTRQGIDHALAVAGQLRGMRRLKAVVLDPLPTVYPKLPAELAVALGAGLVKPTTAAVEEVE
jgi:magnesium chelatase subunit D